MNKIWLLPVILLTITVSGCIDDQEFALIEAQRNKTIQEVSRLKAELALRLRPESDVIKELQDSNKLLLDEMQRIRILYASATAELKRQKAAEVIPLEEFIVSTRRDIQCLSAAISKLRKDVDWIGNNARSGSGIWPFGPLAPSSDYVPSK